MKITKVEQFVTTVPHIPAIEKNRPGDYLERPIPIIKVHTDEGIYGLGEGARGQRFDDAIESWIGVDVMELTWQNLGGAFGSAVFDIVGKALGVPAHKLMGAQQWEKVPVGYWSCPMEPEEFAAEAEVGAKLGFKTHKLKARPWNIVETVRLMTEAAGEDYGIIVDPNFTFETPEQSIRLAHELEKYNIEAFEDPFSYREYGWDSYRDFRSQTRIPLAPHIADPKMIIDAIKADAADMFNTAGSPISAQQNAGIAEAVGLPVWLQVVGLGLGVSGAFGTHVHAVIKNATIPSDSLHFVRENDLIHGALTPKDGFVEVPTTPGLGIELDMAAVEKYRIA